MNPTAEWAHRFVALVRMRPGDGPRITPAPEHPDPPRRWSFIWW